MTFLSYPFLWLFLPLGLAVYWCVPRRARIPVLLVLNGIFYTYHSRWQLLLLLLSIFITYFGARGIEAHRDAPAAKRWLAVTLTANFSLLLVFKLQPGAFLLYFFRLWVRDRCLLAAHAGTEKLFASRRIHQLFPDHSRRPDPPGEGMVCPA